MVEVEVGDGAALHHVRTQGRDHERRAATALFARLGRESRLKSFTLTVNGRLTRNESMVEFAGDDAVAHVAGACVGDGDFHHDDTVFVTHDAVGCESRQVFKKVLRGGRGRGLPGQDPGEARARRRPTATRSARGCCSTRRASSSPSPSSRSMPTT